MESSIRLVPTEIIRDSRGNLSVTLELREVSLRMRGSTISPPIRKFHRPLPKPVLIIEYPLISSSSKKLLPHGLTAKRQYRCTINNCPFSHNPTFQDERSLSSEEHN